MKRSAKLSRYLLPTTLAAGVLLSVLLLAQCVRTYVYARQVLIPQEAHLEAERKTGAVGSAARAAAIYDPHDLSPLLERTIREAPELLEWMRLLTPEGKVVAQSGEPETPIQIPDRWWERVDNHELLLREVNTSRGRAYIALVPFRMPHPLTTAVPGGSAASGRPPGRTPAYLMEVCVDRAGVAGTFAALMRNLLTGLLASAALLAAMVVIGLRARSYLRGKYLEKELELARRVQSDLLPKDTEVSPHIEFAAAAIPADHVGGDFLDVFETDSGKVSIVLGDVSGKGIPAALLVSVMHGALRAATLTGTSQHESSCERMNRMLCEKSAVNRFATMFWGIFDPLTATLRYVNAGHAAPFLLRAGSQAGHPPERLDQGGPLLGLLPDAKYSSAVVQISPGDLLVVYSDGINEAANEAEEEFGDERVLAVLNPHTGRHPREICDRIMQSVSAFASPAAPQDDRTLLVVRFLKANAAMTA
jgi:serine phosphatase RsbU (regulator of sigma subunit)